MIIMNKILRRAKHWVVFLTQCRKLYRYGGFVQAKVGQIEYGNLFSKETRVLVTGGSKGIGFSIAKKFLFQGATVLITGRNKESLDKVRSLCPVNQGNLYGIEWDISNLNILGEKVREAEAVAGGPISILVNNAGIYIDSHFPNTTPEEWEKVYETNARGTYFMCQAFCKRWLALSPSSSPKKIINISSQGGFVGANNPYRMTKWDICGLTEFLGKAYASQGIIVNGIAPGIIQTDMQGSFKAQVDNLFITQNPLNRLGLPEEIAELAVFLASDAANFIVGQTICCDGGYSLR